MAATMFGIHLDRRGRYLAGMWNRGQIGCFSAIALVAGLLMWWGATEIIPLRRYSLHAQRINEKICSLRDRRPANVSEKLWEDCVAWASIAHCNICYPGSPTKYDAMLRYEEDLDEKLAGQVDLDTLKWIGERLEKTGPNGQQYFVKVKWWEQWESMLRADPSWPTTAL
jgi:hypothetical protein